VVDDVAKREPSDHGQVVTTAAEVYEEFFVPALFAQFTGPVLSAARVGPGQRVLDVACGTGVLARAAVDVVGPSGSVVGVDINPAMLAVAGRFPGVDWRHGAAEQLSVDSAAFDVVVSQFGLMFFADRVAALAEMVRVLTPVGRAAVAVWAALDAIPGYAAMVEVLDQLFGREAADALRAPFVLGDHALLRDVAATAGFDDIAIEKVAGTARFASLEAWMHTDIRGWTLADRIDDDQFATLLEHAHRDLAGFVGRDGTVAFDAPALVLSARAPR
jgi:SAM-dependent methyltransferase